MAVGIRFDSVANEALRFSLTLLASHTEAFAFDTAPGFGYASPVGTKAVPIGLGGPNHWALSAGRSFERLFC